MCQEHSAYSYADRGQVFQVIGNFKYQQAKYIKWHMNIVGFYFSLLLYFVYNLETVVCENPQ